MVKRELRSVLHTKSHSLVFFPIREVVSDFCGNCSTTRISTWYMQVIKFVMLYKLFIWIKVFLLWIIFKDFVRICNLWFWVEEAKLRVWYVWGGRVHGTRRATSEQLVGTFTHFYLSNKKQKNHNLKIILWYII